MKLELKHLANYLPYGLKGYISEPIYVEDIAHEMDFSYEIDSGVIEILGCTKETSFQSECMFFRMGSGKDKRDGYISLEEDVKLLLRPLSDLIKPCLEGGKVPMVEICKLFGFDNVRFASNSIGYEVCLFSIEGMDNFSIEWYKELNWFRLVNPVVNTVVKGVVVSILNILPYDKEVMGYLLKNHFDIYTLIQNGLAIDINTIKEEK